MFVTYQQFPFFNASEGVCPYFSRKQYMIETLTAPLHDMLLTPISFLKKETMNPMLELELSYRDTQPQCPAQARYKLTSHGRK
jgi:hypothetical protein